MVRVTQRVYGHDVLNNIVSVEQNDNNPSSAAQTRSFTYDGLSRLTQEINPETGTKSYSYDHAGQLGDLYQRTAMEPNHTDGYTSTATYAFDALHRLTQITYSDPYTTPVTFYWDSTAWLPGQQKGRMVRQDNAGTGGCGAPCAGEEYSYDIDGNVVEKASWTPSNWNTSSKVSYYTYNYLDQPTSMTDIWGNIYTTSYDAAGRANKLTSSISDSTHPPTLYTVNTFTPLGQQSTATFGNGIARAFSYDDRARLTVITDGPSGSPVYSLAVGYAYGNVASANDSINGNWSSFQYDDFNRLKSSWCSANCPDGTNAEGYTNTYDEFGNRWTQSLASGSGPGFTFSYHFDRNNHLTPTSCTNGAGNFCYDGAGNLHYDGLGGGWGYDAEGRVFAYSSISTSASYTSDGLGQRVQRIVNGTTYDYVFDNQGHENTKATGGFAASAWSELYLGGMHVNTYANGSTYFSHSDHLGSERTETDPTGNTNGSYQTNLPFGEWTGGGFESEKGFTGDLFDNADGYVSHTPFRQYTQAQGRWMTPDPAGLAAVNPLNPQTWNRYAYVTNNPTTYNDPSGLIMGLCNSPMNRRCANYDPSSAGISGGTGNNWDEIGLMDIPYVPDGAIRDGSWCLGCGSGFDLSFGDGDGGSGDGGNTGGGPNCTPLTKGCFNVPTQQQQCVSNFYNSSLGKAVQFGSPLSLLPGWNPQWAQNLGEWGTAILGKLGGLFGSGAIPGTTQLTTLNGTTTVGSTLELGTEAVLEAAETAAIPLSVAATVMDVGAHQDCAFGNPYSPGTGR